MDHLTSQEEQSAAGPHGWTAQQGFYVYRNRRLLLAGSWLGLGQGRSWTKEEAHRLARIRLDIPNTADAEWKIDIRKSTASPPVALREHLTRLAEDTRARARRVFAHRGQPVILNPGRTVAQAWSAEHRASGIRYRIDHSASGRSRGSRRCRRSRCPHQGHAAGHRGDCAGATHMARYNGRREILRTGFAGEPPAEVLSVLMVMYRNLVLRKGMTPHLAREQLLHTEPFDNYPDIVAALPDDPHAGDEDDIRH